MNFCMHCGTRLHPKHLEGEGEIPFCDTCGEYRFPVFNTAVSMIVQDQDHAHVLLIQQYGRPSYILVAGYVNRGEDAEHAAVREIGEELDMEVLDLHFNRSRYFPPSNTLMLNFTATVRGNTPHPNAEVDRWQWFTPAQARESIRPNSLARQFLLAWLEDREQSAP